MVNLVPQALVDVAASEGWLGPALHTMLLLQMTVQGCWHSDSSVLTLSAFHDQSPLPSFTDPAQDSTCPVAYWYLLHFK